MKTVSCVTSQLTRTQKERKARKSCCVAMRIRYFNEAVLPVSCDPVLSATMAIASDQPITPLEIPTQNINTEKI